ncbi:hypothetical protein [Limimaricola pyoseonensis]|uniref:Uncharacterized protein n=1 Tax=Limimaricola pyoseonensis TaxID=521013 RepID=A0A1G6ZMB0_9RHOB|nr:hypothetical protein [Limimaricola pyoseonensis]SDE03660.1 hypothetical protein SAMN04488567_0595 [Limimaricola pyoseonensis]
MRGPEPRPLFLVRASYRRRRLRDAARLAPAAAALLWTLPLIWPRGETRISVVLVYLFVVWGLSVAVAALMARALLRADAAEPGPRDAPDEREPPE